MPSTRLRRSIKKKNWSKLFDELDENDDGVLNYQEFWKYKEIRTSHQLSDALNLFDVSWTKAFSLKVWLFYIVLGRQ